MNYYFFSINQFIFYLYILNINIYENNCNLNNSLMYIIKDEEKKNY